VHAASNCSDSHVRRQVTGISFLCAPHYLNLFRNVPIPEGRSLRRASGLVLVGDQDVIQMGSGESVLGSRQVFTNCGRFTCTINRHLGQMPPKPVAGLPIQIGNDKGRYHSLKSTARGRSCGGRLLAFVATLPLAGRGCSKLPPKPTSGESSALAQLAGLRILQRLHTPFRTLELAAIAEWSRSQHALKARLIASALEKP
jgi:hypothetical protein